jgi:glycosyltransferase involved in cell wall biosynthesis
MIAKIVHDNLNAGGGSERLTIATIEALNEMGFVVDVETYQQPRIRDLEKDFGQLDIRINQAKKLDLLSLLRLGKDIGEVDTYHYDLIINTHGDLLPYSSIPRNNGLRKTIMITYCHYPLVPFYIRNGLYRRYLSKFLTIGESYSSDHIITDTLISNAHLLYDKMMTNTIILTNSEFSKRAIKLLYKNIEEPIVLSPPVDVETFHRAALYSKEEERENTILVVSRFSPDKEVENAIRIAKILYEKKKIHYNMIIVGNIHNNDIEYLDFLRSMINGYGLKNYVKLEVGASFERLLHLMSKSKVYLHPLAGEPFGISVAEAMAAGLIPVVPHVGGNSEFVPQQYHYSSLEEAAEITEDALVRHDFNNSDYHNNNIENNNNNIITTAVLAASPRHEQREKLSNLVMRFSTENYKNRLRKIIGLLK